MNSNPIQNSGQMKNEDDDCVAKFSDDDDNLTDNDILQNGGGSIHLTLAQQLIKLQNHMLNEDQANKSNQPQNRFHQRQSSILDSSTQGGVASK